MTKKGLTLLETKENDKKMDESEAMFQNLYNLMKEILEMKVEVPCLCLRMFHGNLYCYIGSGVRQHRKYPSKAIIDYCFCRTRNYHPE